MRVLAACSLGGAGHLRPLVPFLAAARDAGHDVEVVAPPGMVAMVEEAGFRCRRGGEPAEDQIAPIRERLPTAARDEALVLGNRELFGRLAAQAMLPAVERAGAEWRPDLVLRDPCEYASAAVALARDIPMAQVAISLADGEAASIAAAAPALEKLRAGTTGAITAAPYLSRLPESIDPSAFPMTARYHEPPAGTRAGGGGGMLPAWWRNADEDAPFVYLSFGTVLGYMSLAGGVFRAALDAVGSLPVRVLLTTGHRMDPGELGRVPDNVHVEAFVDQREVLGHADLVVCHGGSGTAYGALARGVPVVVVPVFADHVENGRRIVQAGAGVMVEPAVPGRVVGPGDAPRIADAVELVLGGQDHRGRARALAGEMDGAPDPAALLDALASGAFDAPPLA
jgi:UDP:flavonoid glycosyltransferase YjiC (YdhE family)